MKSAKVLAFSLAAAVAFTGTSALAAGDGDGEKIFKRKCGICHTVEPGNHKIGPSLAGVMGRQAGTADGFSRYQALKGADFTWDEDTMDAWITDAKGYAKENLGSGTAMTAKIRKEDDREAIIEYLKSN